MSFFDFFKKKKSSQTQNTQQPITNKAIATSEKNYKNIIEIANIISNGDPKVLEDFTLLVNDIDAFLNKYNEWYSNMLRDTGTTPNKHTSILLITAYWLCGDDTDYEYGGYIDWKEETSDILYILKPVIEKLNYPLTVDDITFGNEDEEFTDEVLLKINNHFQKKRLYPI